MGDSKRLIIRDLVRRRKNGCSEAVGRGIQQTIEWYLHNREWWENILSGEYQNYFDKMYNFKSLDKI